VPRYAWLVITRPSLFLSFFSIPRSSLVLSAATLSVSLYRFIGAHFHERSYGRARSRPTSSALLSLSRGKIDELSSSIYKISFFCHSRSSLPRSCWIFLSRIYAFFFLLSLLSPSFFSLFLAPRFLVLPLRRTRSVLGTSPAQLQIVIAISPATQCWIVCLVPIYIPSYAPRNSMSRLPRLIDHFTHIKAKKEVADELDKARSS